MCREVDTAAEVAAKLTLIAIYNERLTERARHREFILRHGLLDVKPQQVTFSALIYVIGKRVNQRHGLMDVKIPAVDIWRESVEQDQKLMPSCVTTI